MAGKYNHIDFKPPKSVADAAARGLALRQKAKKSHKGGLSTGQAAKAGVGSGVQRAVNLKNRNKLSPETVRRMLRFFQRHEKNRKIDKGKTPASDRGYQAWMIWGGNPGYAWARKIVRQMDAADKRANAQVSVAVDIIKSAGTITPEIERHFDVSELARIASELDSLLYFDAANSVDDAIRKCLERKMSAHKSISESV